MRKRIGISRNINLGWLNKAAELYISGKDEKEIIDALDEYLSLEIKSPTNLKKTRGILMNIWGRDVEGRERIKKIAIELLKTGKNENILLGHWCLMLVAYPVFTDICSIIGKMDRQRFHITNRDIKNKMFDLWGERSTLYHSIDKNIKTLKDIGVLDTLPKNRYGINRYNIENKKGIILIAYTLTYIKEKLYISTMELNNSPEFFPFEYNITIDILEDSNIFSIDRFGGELVVSR
ncbi:MAG TPA: hypothetical protein GXX70_05015 [Tepidimicrobium sp.]|nr:hypothetical protein [Tepidimicrobium sp.]